MKLRVQGNTLRLRLSQSDVTRLAETGVLREVVTFAAGQTLEYSLESRTRATVSASFERGHIRIVLPQPRVTHWIQSDQVGIEGSDGPLSVLVEKDFQCLHQDSSKDADAFPNPQGGITPRLD
jgi:hypothetical protein